MTVPEARMKEVRTSSLFEEKGMEMRFGIGGRL